MPGFRTQMANRIERQLEGQKNQISWKDVSITGITSHRITSHTHTHAHTHFDLVSREFSEHWVLFVTSLSKEKNESVLRGRLIFQDGELAHGFLSAPSPGPMKMVKKEQERSRTPAHKENRGAGARGFGRREVRERTVDFLTKSSVPFVFEIVWIYCSAKKRFFFFKLEGTFVVLVLLLRVLIKTTLIPSQTQLPSCL